ncbi:hypothetical protein PTKIN_Ptkin08bG0175700 [Pterospermum kingtungense]
MAYALVALLVLALGICHSTAPPVSTAAASTGITTERLPLVPFIGYAEGFLEPHNEARADVGVGPLKWSDRLGNDTDLIAKNHSEGMVCQFADLPGSNQMVIGGAMVTPRRVVESWVLLQKKYYNFANNSCAPGHDCGLYANVVRKDSLELGCAFAPCKYRSTLIICMYSPVANYVGERAEAILEN